MSEDDSCVARMLAEFRGKSLLSTNARPSQFPVLDSLKPFLFTNSENANKKKPFDETVLNINNSLIKKRRRKSFDDGNDSENECNVSTGTPWETKHLRTELAKARAQIKVLESRVSELNGFQNIASILSEQEKAAYKADINRERNTVLELERRVKCLKRREDTIKEQYSEAMETMKREKTELESKTIDLFDENNKLKEEIVEIDDAKRSSELKLRESECTRESLELELGLTKDHVVTLNDQLEKLKMAMRDAEELKAKLACASLKIMELESEKQSEAESAAVVAAQQVKLLKYTDLERQLKQLTSQNSKLKENVNNTLYLETIVEELRGRLAGLDERERELTATRIELGVIETKLAEYRNLCDEVLGGTVDKSNVTPHKLFEYIRQLQDRNLVEKELCLQLSNKVKRLEESERTSSTECSRLKEEIVALKEELDNCNKNLKRLKKQNALIIWERNDLRSLVDSCQKEMTIGGVVDTRTEALEKMVESYRKKLQQIEADPSLLPSTGDKSNSVDVENLKEENEKLKKTLEDLQYELEHRALKGDFNTQNTKILHFKMNPTALAMEERMCDKEKLEKELLQLKERLRLVEEGNVHNLTQNVQANINDESTKELRELREKTKRLEMQNQRLKEAFKTTGHEFREAIYALLGYKVDALPNKVYRLSNLYSDSQDQHLIFKMNNGGGMELLETEFSRSLAELVESVLVLHNSIPVFLASLTVDLFKRQTASFAPSTIMEI